MNKYPGYTTINPLNEPHILYDNTFFETLLDNTCNKLHEMQVKHSIKRIGEMEAVLKDLEDELDALIPLTAEKENVTGSV